MQRSFSSLFTTFRLCAQAGLIFIVLVGNVFADVDSARGQALYENHCGTCHDNNVHKREKRQVTSMNDLRAWVAAMGAHTGLDWRAEDVADVAFYLSLRMYDFAR